jgi:hypothetical protein
VDLGPDGTGYAFTAANGNFYKGVLLSGAYAEAAKNGFPPLADMCGMPGDNDLVINQAAFIIQDIVAQMNGGPNGNGPEDGTRQAMPLFSSWPTVPIFQTSSAVTTQDILKSFLGTALGYLGVVYFGPRTKTTWAQFWQKVWETWMIDRFENEHGQDAIAVMNDMQPLTEGVMLRQWSHIEIVKDAGKVTTASIQNIEKYEYDYDPVEGKYLSGVLEFVESVSRGKYGPCERSEGHVTGKEYTADKATADDSAMRLVLDRAFGIGDITLLGRLRRMIPLPLGVQFRAQDERLITTGIHAVYPRTRTIDPETETIEITGRDRGTTAVGNVLMASFWLDEPAAQTAEWTDEPAAPTAYWR